ncbi:hypothetical protein GCM10023237_17960 [Streptomyces coeruleoprunus]
MPVPASTRLIVPSSRDDTSRSPSGSAASPQGDFSPWATVDTTRTDPLAGAPEGDALADGAAGADVDAPGLRGPSPGGFSSPDEHPVATNSTAAANTAVTAGRCTVSDPFPQRRRELQATLGPATARRGQSDDPWAGGSAAICGSVHDPGGGEAPRSAVQSMTPGRAEAPRSAVQSMTRVGGSAAICGWVHDPWAGGGTAISGSVHDPGGGKRRDLRFSPTTPGPAEAP